MWTSTIDLDPRRVLLTRLLGYVWRGAYFSSFAPLRVQNLPRQTLPASSWVRVRNRLAGICGSDLHFIHADGDFRIAPAAIPGHNFSYPGHEVVGEVIEVGDEVSYLKVGDRVALQHGPNCLSSGVQPPCRSCSYGNHNLCEHGVHPGPRPIGGGWSEEMLLHEQQLFRLSPTTSDEQAVMLEPVAVALHAVLRYLPRPGDRVLIVGAGTIGLLTIEIIRALAPDTEISVLARYPFQIEQATRMGASHIIYPEDSYVNIQKTTHAELYQGLLGNSMLLGGFDVIYDTVGHRNTLHHVLRWARAQATVVLVGLSLHMMHIDLTPIWYQEMKLIGSLGHGVELWPLGTYERRSTFSIAAEMIEQGLLQPERLITHRFALNNYRQALIAAAGKASSRATKVVFDFSLLPPTVVPNVRASSRQRRPAVMQARSNVPRFEQDSTSQADQDANVPVTPVSVAVQPAIDPYSSLPPQEEEEEVDDTAKSPALKRPSHDVQPQPLAEIVTLPETLVGPIEVDEKGMVAREHTGASGREEKNRSSERKQGRSQAYKFRPSDG